MTSRGQEKGLQPYGALDCFGWRSEGVQGASGKPPAFLPEYLYPVGFFANYGPKGVQANNKRSARQCGPRRLFAPRKAPQCARRRIPYPIDTPTPRRGAGGNVGKRVPGGHNRRRRLATRSSGKQQAGRTAVRTAPIVCPEESRLCFLADYGPKGVQGASGKPPCIASLKDNFAARDSPRWGLTRRLWRVGMACSPMGRSIASRGEPKGTGGERKAPSAPAGANPCPPRGMTRRLRREGRACSPMARSHFSFGGERKVCKRKPAARQLLRPAPLRVAGFGLR